MHIRLVTEDDAEFIVRLRTDPEQARYVHFVADYLVNETDIDKIAEGFYNDTYLFDQNACSAPHLIVWLGSAENKKKAKDIFFSQLWL